MVRCLWSTGFVPAVRSWSWAAVQAVRLQVENLKLRVTQEVKSSVAQSLTLLHHPHPPLLIRVKVLQSNLHTQASLTSHLLTECPINLAPMAKSHSATKPARVPSMAPTLWGDKRTNGHENWSTEICKLGCEVCRNFSERQRLCWITLDFVRNATTANSIPYELTHATFYDFLQSGAVFGRQFHYRTTFSFCIMYV